MTETVTLKPSQTSRYDSNGNPILPGPGQPIQALEVEPGNGLLAFGIGGDLDDVAFTVYCELGTPIHDDDELEVRGRHCRARVALWDSGGQGGLAVLARSVTGASAR